VDLERIAWRTYRAGDTPGPLVPERRREKAGEPIRLVLVDPPPGLLRVELAMKPAEEEDWIQQTLTLLVPASY
jgi:hypothetical protein